MRSFDSSSTALLQEVKFPQFGNCIIGYIKADVFDSPGYRYEIIVGRDVLLRMGISLDFQSKVTRWMGHEIPMKSTTSIAMDIPSVQEHERFYWQELEEDLLIMAELFSDEIMDRKYQAVSPEEVVQQLDHLSSQQKTSSRQSSKNTRGCLMEPLDVIQLWRLILNLSQAHNQYIKGHIRCHIKNRNCSTESCTT
mgnify:CR=1 FL=1